MHGETIKVKKIPILYLWQKKKAQANECGGTVTRK